MKTTNQDRAKWAQAAADTFAAETNMDTAGEELETILGDLLCDIMHLCNQKGIDFGQVLNSGQLNFERELVQEADERSHKMATTSSNLCVDGHEYPDLESNWAGDGQFPPFAVFDIDAQENLLPYYPTRDLAEESMTKLLQITEPSPVMAG